MNEPVMVEMVPSVSLALFLLILCLTITPGVSGQVTLVVTMTHYSICAVTGSSVEMPCSFTHQHKPDLIVNKVYWGINAQRGVPLPDLLNNQAYTGRVQYETDMKKTCTLMLSDVRVTDTADYYARIQTTTPGEKWQSAGVTLTVKALAVDTSGPAIEGKDVRLRCKSHCNLTQSSKILWKKIGKNVLDTQTNSDLILHNIKIEDEGHYSCSVKDKAYHPSPQVKLNVMYPPKKTSVSLSPAGEIHEGSSVTLTCSSDANPPVESYTWYRTHRTAKSTVGSEQIYSLLSISSKHSGHYYCVVKNQYGVGNSTAVHLDVQYGPRSPVVVIDPPGNITEGSRVTLTCSSDANPPVESYTWFKVNESTPVGSGQQYSITDIRPEDGGQYYCEARNKYGAENSTTVSITVTSWQSPLSTAVITVSVCGAVGLLCFVFLMSKKCKKNATQTREDRNTRDYVNVAHGGPSDGTQPDAIYQSLNPNTTQPDAVYHSLNPNTTQPDAVYQSLNLNTTQPDADYQNLNLNTTQPDAVYQSLNPNATQPDAVYQTLNTNTT